MIETLNELPEVLPANPEPVNSTADHSGINSPPPRLEAFFSIPVTVELVLATLKMPVSHVMDFQVGTEIDLDHKAGAEVALVVNGSRIAFGHLFLIDPQLRTVGVRISKLASIGEAA